MVLDALARMKCMDVRVSVLCLLSISEAPPPSSTVAPLQGTPPIGGSNIAWIQNWIGSDVMCRGHVFTAGFGRQHEPL